MCDEVRLVRNFFLLCNIRFNYPYGSSTSLFGNSRRDIFHSK